MSRFFVDTNVFLYALGAEHRYREPCRRLVELADERRLRPEASIELLQELLWVRARRLGDRAQAARDAGDVADLCVVHPVERHDFDLAVRIFGEHDHLSPRDALHAATALGRGVQRIVSADRHLDGIDGLRRIDPVDVAAIETLLDGG